MSSEWTYTYNNDDIGITITPPTGFDTDTVGGIEITDLSNNTTWADFGDRGGSPPYFPTWPVMYSRFGANTTTGSDTTNYLAYNNYAFKVLNDGWPSVSFFNKNIRFTPPPIKFVN